MEKNRRNKRINLQIRNMNKRLAALVLAIAAVMLSLSIYAVPAEAAAKQTVIVLDPGHSSEQVDTGAIYSPYVEGNMTLVLAAYVWQELSQFDNTAVYMTRYDGHNLTLAERVDYAHSVGADFLACLHFNAIGDGSRNGAEVLVSATPELFPSECFFAQTELDELKAQGLSIRGIRFRIGQHGDYYGVIRRATAYGMQSAIIEHCYLDGTQDRTFLSQKNALLKLAHADATAIAKHLHLKSTALGVDYTNFAEGPITYSVEPFQ